MSDDPKIIQFRSLPDDALPVRVKERDYTSERCHHGLHPDVEMDRDTHLLTCSRCKQVMSAWTYLEGFATHDAHIGWKFREVTELLRKKTSDLDEIERQIDNAKARRRRMMDQGQLDLELDGKPGVRL